MSRVVDPAENTEDGLSSLTNNATDVSALIQLYEKNRDAFFHLAVAGVPASAEPWKLELAGLAAKIRLLVNSAYTVTDGDSPGRCRFHGKREWVEIDQSQREVLVAFLDRLGGSRDATGAPRDFVGTTVSDAEIEFKLGTSEHRRGAKERLRELNTSRPRVLQLDNQDLEAIQHGMPNYVIHELLKCATRVVQAPTAVFEGTRLGGPLSNATAYCGKPRRAFGNDGAPMPAPAGMVYCVYSDPQGWVFDWDWVNEDRNSPGSPVEFESRFGRRIEVTQGAVLSLPLIAPSAFKKSKAWHSHRGDCMFFYASEAHAYAVRTNDDLTEYRSFDKDDLVGCKIKNFAEILSKLSVSMPAVPVSAILTASLVRQLEDHQRKEKEQFLRVIAQYALDMVDTQRQKFLTELLKMDAESDDYLLTIRNLALRYTATRENSVDTFITQSQGARQEIEQRYLRLIAAAGSARITTARAA